MPRESEAGVPSAHTHCSSVIFVAAKKFIFTFLFAIALLFAKPVFAWNSTGHELIAFITWSQLTPESKGKITALLQQHPDYQRTFTRESTPEGSMRDEQAFVIAATWPDLIRSQTFGKSAIYSRPSWHFVDLPFVIEGVPPPAFPNLRWVPGTEPQNAIQAMKKNIADLKDANLAASDRAIALCWLEHLVGDIHQPLHATSMFSRTYPQGDRGGNGRFLNAEGLALNLHSLWDGMLGGFMEIGAVKEIANKLEVDHPAKEFVKQLAVTDMDEWAQESFEQAKKSVYLDGNLQTAPDANSARPPPAVPPGYMDASRQLASLDATLAGYRLAAMLNEIFAAPPVPATTPGNTER